MMRNGDIYSIAIRKPNGEIFVRRLHWRAFQYGGWRSWPFIRGFPILLETLANGIHALNFSARIAEGEPEKKSSRLSLAASLTTAILVAIALFVIAPHFLSALTHWLGAGSDVDGLGFHLWDGFYKCAIFIAYIWLISLIPEIRRVFEYHGAEHKTIHAWEKGLGSDYAAACGMSRLHPRCGTTFLLFVICASIFIQALLIPLFFHFFSGLSFFPRHLLSIAIKIALIAPISGAAYELIRFAAKLPDGFFSTLLQAPGLALQRLTTREPDRAQLEVAAAALNEAMLPDGVDPCGSSWGGNPTAFGDANARQTGRA